MTVTVTSCRETAIKKMNEYGEGYVVVKISDWYYHVDYHVIKEEDYDDREENGIRKEIIKRFE